MNTATSKVATAADGPFFVMSSPRMPPCEQHDWLSVNMLCSCITVTAILTRAPMMLLIYSNEQSVVTGPAVGKVSQLPPTSASVISPDDMWL